MGDYTAVNSDNNWTSTASAAIVGGQLVESTGDNTVGPAAGTLRPVGVAQEDASSGQRVTIWQLPGLVHELPLKNTITVAAGAPIVAAAAAPGRIDTGTLATVAAAGTLIGICLRGGTGTSAGTGAAAMARFIGV